MLFNLFICFFLKKNLKIKQKFSSVSEENRCYNSYNFTKSDKYTEYLIDYQKTKQKDMDLERDR